jgi:octaprenyl-diphosphate synthase
MPDHLVDYEAQKLLGEIRIEIGVSGQLTESPNLPLLSCRIGRGQVILGLVAPNRLRHLEAFSQHENQRCIDIVDAFAVALKAVICHLPLTCAKRPAMQANSLALRVGGRQRSGMTATLHRIGPERSPSLDPMINLVAAEMNHVNAVILERMQSQIPLIPELAGHLIAGGGKRMRPMLTLASARLLDYSGTRHHKLAAAVEFIHTATLLHDDVVDGSDLRRGRRTANIIWGNPASVLVGDFLFSRSFELMVEDGSLKVLKILSNASAVIAEGEVNQLTAQRQIGTGEDKYLEIIGAKTAALFAAACRISAVVAERSEHIEEALDSYGRNLGIAFQLVDDAIDYASDAETMGKGVGDDFRDGKVTLPVILAYARAAAEDKAFWQAAMEGRKVSDVDLDRAQALLIETRAIDDTMMRARHYGQRAIDALGPFAESAAKAALVEAVEFAIARAY